MKELTLKIPTKPEFKRWWEIVKFKAHGGFKCLGCGLPTFFDKIDISHRYKDKRFLFGSHNNSNYCTSCVQKEIDDNHAKIFVETKSCDWCNSDDPTVHYYNFHPTDGVRVNFTLGMNSWNSANICQSCMHGALEAAKGNEESSILTTKNGKLVSVNSLGLSK